VRSPPSGSRFVCILGLGRTIAIEPLHSAKNCTKFWRKTVLQPPPHAPINLGSAPIANKDDVLYSFAVDGEPDLEEYLREYPQYAAELIDLAHELSREEKEGILSEADNILIEKGWRKINA
jgi:hypothetical protein